MNKTDKIFIAGHRGLVGSAILRQLQNRGFKNILTKKRNELDLCSQSDVNSFFSIEKPDYVILAAAKVGGIYANNTYPADFIYQNLMIEANIIHASYKYNAKRLLFLGSSCIYPKNASQPMKESSLLSDVLESTNEPYAIAKIAGIKLCESYNRQYGPDFRSVMPTNLYGINDNFHPNNSHVIPALMQRFHSAKITNKNEVIIWGTGKPMREFLYVDDMANASIFIMDLDKKDYIQNTKPMLSHINVGTGKDISIKEVAELMKDIVGFKGEVNYDTSMPDGPSRKLIDISLITNLGWNHTTSLSDGLKKTYDWYVSEVAR